MDEDEIAEATPTDRSNWEKRASPETVRLADDLLNLAKKFDPSLTLSYNKYYIGIFKNGRPYNFCMFEPRKRHINLDVKLPRDRRDRRKNRSG